MMARPRRTPPPPALSPGWRYLLERGQMPPDDLMGEGDDVVALYRALRGGPEVETRWRQWRLVILLDWRTAGRRGQPWAEKKLGPLAVDGAIPNGHGNGQQPRGAGGHS